MFHLSMKSFSIFTFIFLSFVFSKNVMASYYDVLPKGVRNFTYRFVATDTIKGSYNSGGDFKGYNVNANINADSIKGINGAVDVYLGTLSAEDYANFSFGTFQGEATSKLTAQGFGGGYGITDKLTFYGFIPYYTAQVDLDIKRTSKGRNNVGTAIQLENLPDVDVRLIQSLFVNYYQYRPLGKWKASDFGDTEAGFMYQIKKWRNAGALIAGGIVAPTGRVDDPDILQDISFGDGQWDAFYEFGGGINLNEDWSFDQWNRFVYQFPYETQVRLPESSTFPVTSNKGTAKIKLGNKFQSNFQLNYRWSDEWMSSLIYGAEYIEKTKYETSSANANTILADDTEKMSHIGRMNLSYSTLNLFKKKKFFMPISFNLALQTVFAGKNTPKYERADFEVRFFF
jgi:hypothetical protein